MFSFLDYRINCKTPWTRVMPRVFG